MPDSDVSRLMTLFDRALELPRDERASFAEQEAHGDAALQHELKSLLEAHETSSGYFERLADAVVSPAFAALALDSLTSAGGPPLVHRVQAALSDSYEIVRELGGGMSRVFLARETKLNRRVVIKVLPPEMGASANAERFRREIQVAARLQHAHIVPLLTSGIADSLVYFTMPFVDGESLRARLDREKRLPVEDARRIWRDVLEALAYAHSEGVVHRDVKPANILLNAAGGSALMSDFGIARAIQAAAGDSTQTATGFAIGTPAYMAPEQVTGDGDADQRVDIYAAGLVMYEMLEGRLPFSGASVRELLWARLTKVPAAVTRPDCPPKLARLVSRCLARDPANRPASVADILAELDAIPVLRPTGSTRRRRLISYALAAVGIAGAIAGAAHLTTRPSSEATFSDAPPVVAVLPLKNYTADSSDIPLTDAMTAELIDALSRSADLQIVGSASVLAFKDQPMTVRQIAESLHVSRVLEGGFQKIGNRIRLRVQLVDPHSNTSYWSASFDREFAEIFAVEDSIFRAIVHALWAEGPDSRRQTVSLRRRLPKPDAFEWYLRGLSPTQRFAAGHRQSIEYFNRAIAADSSFGDAYVALAAAYRDQAGDSKGEAEVLLRAKQASLKAVALDDSLAAAHTALGWAQLRIGPRADSPAFRDWAAAESELKRALKLNPRDPLALEGLSLVYLYTGNRAEQLAVSRRALAIDPFSYSAIRRLALALSMNGQCEEAIARLRPLQAMHAPGEVAGIVTGGCYAANEKWDEAIAEFRWAEENGARVAFAFLGYAQARAGHADEANKILSDLISERKYSFGSFGIAVVYAGLRNYNEAFAWLDKAVDETTVRPYIMGPMFDELRRDPRFAVLRAQMGLPSAPTQNR